MEKRKCNEFMTNDDIDIMCESIMRDYESDRLYESSSMSDLDLEMREKAGCFEDPEKEAEYEKDIKEMSIEELREKYLSSDVQTEMFEDPDNPRAPSPTPLIPSLNFDDTNEDIALDPTSFDGSGALPSIASDILGSGLTLE